MRTTHTVPTSPEPRTQGRPPKGADDAEPLADLLASLYLREWKVPSLDLRLLYASAQLQIARERYFAGLPDASDRTILLLRRWFAHYCGERAVRNALALGRGGELRQARVAARILAHRLDHPDLTRAEEAVVIGRAVGLVLDASAHRRAVDAMFAAMRRYGPDLLRDLAWKTPERWQHYEARYGIGWAAGATGAGPPRDDGTAASARPASPAGLILGDAGADRLSGGR